MRFLPLFLIIAALPLLGQNVDNYKEQGGSRTVIGGSLDVVSGGELDIESGGALKIAGVAVSATAAELNANDGVPMSVTFGTAAVGGNTGTITVQVEDGTGADVAAVAVLDFYLSDVATGDAITATAPDGNIVIGTDGAIIASTVADKYLTVASESDGDIDFLITHSATKTYYLVCVLPTGAIAISGAIAIP